MTDNVTRFPGAADGKVGNGAVLDPDILLEANKGAFAEIVIIGRQPNGDVAVVSSHDSFRALWLVHRGAHFLLHDTGWEPTP